MLRMEKLLVSGKPKCSLNATVPASIGIVKKLRNDVLELLVPSGALMFSELETIQKFFDSAKASLPDGGLYPPMELLTKQQKTQLESSQRRVFKVLDELYNYLNRLSPVKHVFACARDLTGEALIQLA